MLWNPSANRVRENINLHSLYEPHYRLVVILTYYLVRCEELNVSCGYERSKSKPSCLRWDTLTGVAGRGGGASGAATPGSKMAGKIKKLIFSTLQILNYSAEYKEIQ
jgi:hypothetical protein